MILFYFFFWSVFVALEIRNQFWCGFKKNANQKKSRSLCVVISPQPCHCVAVLLHKVVSRCCSDATVFIDQSGFSF